MLIFSREYADQHELETILAALASFKDPRSVEPLIHLTQDAEELPVRVGSAGVLGRLGDVRAGDVLVPLMQDKNGDLALRTAASESLARLGGARAAATLNAVLSDERDSIEVRRQVAYVTYLLGPPAASALVQTIQHSTDERLLVNALNSLGRIGTNDVLPVLADAESRHPDGAVNKAAREAQRAVKRRSAG
jgi:HEAT repeat protein